LVKKRLIFTLLYDNGFFVLSRNFTLQKVGDLQWLNRHYNFQRIAFSIDELIMLDVSRKGRDVERFCEHVKAMTHGCFVPIAAGGGIRKVSDAKALLDSGADKIVLNTVLHKDTDLVRELISTYGSQCIIGSVDLKKRAGSFHVMVESGLQEIEISASEYIRKICDLGIGEVYLNSIDRDGTGQGYLLETLELIEENIKTPVILAGGAGNHRHLLEGIRLDSVGAVATANLFNFIGTGLPSAREALIAECVPLAKWDQGREIELENYFSQRAMKTS
jgi:cyclase